MRKYDMCRQVKQTYQLFGLIKLLRLFRVRALLALMDTALTVNYNLVAMTRALCLIIFLTHLMACGLLFVAVVVLNDGGIGVGGVGFIGVVGGKLVGFSDVD